MHLRPAAIALVAVGGVLGTAAREGLSLAIPPVAGVPVAIFGINIVGAFVLGVLLESLLMRGPDEGARRNVRLFVGTGVLGGFTTYSALATDTDLLIRAGSVWTAIGYALATVVVGGLASLLGIWLAGRFGRRADSGGAEAAPAAPAAGAGAGAGADS